MQAMETVWHLEMRRRDQLKPAPESIPAIEMKRVTIPCPELNYGLYSMVGRPWKWTDRHLWPRQKWIDHVNNPHLHTWIGYVEGTPIGYAEIEADDRADVEIRSFGLLQSFIGKGFGKRFLSRALEVAWDRPASRVWLHTCSFDHPHALANYQARGLELFKTEQQLKYFPDEPVEPVF